FAFWLLVTRQHHPTWIVAASATAVLVSAFALAVYVNSLWLLPKFSRSRLWLRYLLSLLALVAVLDLAAVLAIQLIYDWLGVTREGRYSFWFNMASDGAGIIVHVVLAMGVWWVAKPLRREARQQRTVEG
ncbi:MAG TPA: hypothetical protein VF766_04970, partial [Pyrinomonadaceae bacterium]